MMFGPRSPVLPPTPPVGLLLDFTLCIGCRACETSCKEANGLSPEPPAGRLDASNYTVVLQHPSGQFYRRMCMHCESPTCASVCPVKALEKTPEGPVVYHGDRCLGCRYCMMACPFNVPTYEWDHAVPVVRKCILCAGRLAEGERPACAWVCPVGACRFGERERLLELATRRVRNFPERYVDAIYGELEVGGTSVLMLSGVPFTELGMRTDLGEKPLPELTWTVMSKIPNVVITGAILLGGISWIINRRMEIGHERSAEIERLRAEATRDRSEPPDEEHRP